MILLPLAVLSLARAFGLDPLSLLAAPRDRAPVHRVGALLQAGALFLLAAAPQVRFLPLGWLALPLLVMAAGAYLEVRTFSRWRRERNQGMAADPALVLPRIAPRNPLDLALTFACGAGIVLAVLLPLALLAMLTGFWPVFVLGAALVVVVAHRAVTGVLRIDAAGLRFAKHRTPLVVGWEEITAVRAAPRWEVIVRGWLWPPLAPRESTTSLTSLGHYRIDWGRGHCYYPPCDEARFRELLLVHAPPHVSLPWRGGGATRIAPAEGSHAAGSEP